MSEKTAPITSQGIQVLLGFITVVGSVLFHLSLCLFVLSQQLNFLLILIGISFFITPILMGFYVLSKNGWTGFLPGILIGMLMMVVIPCSAFYILCGSTHF
jgi:hypothetical protein